MLLTATAFLVSTLWTAAQQTPQKPAPPENPAAPAAEPPEAPPAKPVPPTPVRSGAKVRTATPAPANEIHDVVKEVNRSLRGLDLFQSSSEGGRTLVIGTRRGDAEAQAAFEEDLNVMSHILRKAAGRSASSSRDEFMGISVSSSRAPQAIYLDGYGALFLLNVKVALQPPGKSKESDRSRNDRESSDWDEARRELFGGRGGSSAAPANPTPYDRERVDALRTELLKALKNGSNIRDLKKEDWIVVAAISGESSPTLRFGGLEMGTGYATIQTTPDARRAEHAMATRQARVSNSNSLIIRIKKLDADAFASGKIELSEFEKRAQVNIN
jgi:hypothetical protein